MARMRSVSRNRALFCVHCNALHRTATHCNALHRTAMHCNALQRTATHCIALQRNASHRNTQQRPATHCNTLQRTIGIRIVKNQSCLALMKQRVTGPSVLRYLARHRINYVSTRHDAYIYVSTSHSIHLQEACHTNTIESGLTHG